MCRRCLVLLAAAAFGSLPGGSSAQQPVPISAQIVVSNEVSRNEHEPATARDAAGRFLVVWADGPASSDGSARVLRGRIYDSSGAPRTDAFDISKSTEPARHQQPRICAAAGGGFVVVWVREVRSQDGGLQRTIRASRVGLDGPSSPQPFVISSLEEQFANSPALACDDAGGFVAVWEGGTDRFKIRARRYDAADEPAGPALDVSSEELYSEYAPSVAMRPDRGFVVTWRRRNEIAARLYGSDDTPLGPAFIVEADAGSTIVSKRDADPRVATDAHGGFVIAWTDVSAGCVPSYSSNGCSPPPGRDGSGDGVYARRFDPDGQPAGSSFAVPLSTVAHQGDPDLAMDLAGNFVVSWTTRRACAHYYLSCYSLDCWTGCSRWTFPTDPPREGVLGQVFLSDGTRHGQPFEVSPLRGARGPQGKVALAPQGGHFIVVWGQLQQNQEDASDVLARLYQATGLPELPPTPTPTPPPTQTATPIQTATPSPTPLAEGDLSFLGPHSAVSGHELLVPIVFDAGDRPLGSYAVNVTWDPALLELLRVEGGSTPEFSQTPLYEALDGATVHVAGSNGSSVDTPRGVVSLAVMVFRALGEGGSGELSFVSASLQDTAAEPYAAIQPLPGWVMVQSAVAAPGTGLVAALLLLSAAALLRRRRGGAA
jgi:hypothetical protein